MLCNSESWYNVSKAELELLETVDTQFLRGVLKAPKSTPKEMLFLELGCVPFRNIIKKRRILFLHYILNEDPKSMMNRFLMTQIQNKKPKDWITKVLEDLEEINLKLEDIKVMKKSALKILLNRLITDKAFQELTNKKLSHSKVMNIQHKKLEMQKYLKPSGLKIKQEEAQEIFKMRSKVSDVKTNFGRNYDSFECDICQQEDESQQHIIECKEINKLKESDDQEMPEYDEILKENIRKQVKIVKTFQENIKIREKLTHK